MVIPTFQQSNSALTTASLSKLFRDGLLSAVIPAPSINKPRMNMPAFKAMTWMAKRPMTRLMAPQTMPRTAALRMVLRAQTTSRAWFWAESKTGWCDIDSGLEQTECRKGVEQKESVLARRGYRGERRCGQLGYLWSAISRVWAGKDVVLGFLSWLALYRVPQAGCPGKRD